MTLPLPSEQAEECTNILFCISQLYGEKVIPIGKRAKQIPLIEICRQQHFQSSLCRPVVQSPLGCGRQLTSPSSDALPVAWLRNCVDYLFYQSTSGNDPLSFRHGYGTLLEIK